MGSPDQPRNARGQWSAAGSGAPPADTDTRYIPGHGSVPRSQVVAKHAGAPSVGTAAPTVRLDSASSPGSKTYKGSAKQDRIIAMRATDARHFGPDFGALARKPDLMMPRASATATPGIMGPGVRKMKFK